MSSKKSLKPQKLSNLNLKHKKMKSLSKPLIISIKSVSMLLKSWMSTNFSR